MHELGFLEALLELPHQKAHRVNGRFGALALTVADFGYLQTRCPFIVFMPQWDFLSFLAERAARYPTFSLRMNAEVTGLIEQEGRIVGLRAVTPGGPLNVYASLIVGADGRHSTVRARAGLKGIVYGAPMDVLWFQLSRRAGDPEDPVGRFDAGRIFVMLNRDAYWQCGFVIPKGSDAQIRERGLPPLRDTIAELAPFVAERVGELQDWEAIKLLTVQVIGCGNGIPRAFSALVMQHMRCPPSAVSESTWQFRMQLPHRMHWLCPYGRIDPLLRRCGGFSGVAHGQRG